jgi:thiol-disulfide isomerase/thioredoxin
VAAGLITLLAVLAVALAGGTVWRSRSGRLRDVRPVSKRAEQTREAAVVTAGASAAPARSADDGHDVLSLSGDQLGQPLGDRATLVQFSSAFCAPCRATRVILAEVAEMIDGVAYIEVDAESRLDLVRSLHVLRTPTVLVTDGAGRIVKRASGRPRKPDVIAAVGQAVGSG